MKVKKFLRYSDLVERRILTNRMCLKRWIEREGFPAPVHLGPNSIAFDEEAVEQWLKDRPTKRTLSKPEPASIKEIAAVVRVFLGHNGGPPIDDEEIERKVASVLAARRPVPAGTGSTQS